MKPNDLLLIKYPITLSGNKLRSKNQERRTQNPEHGTQNAKHGTRNAERETDQPFKSNKSSTVSAAIASTIGTARGNTQGS